MRSSVVANTQFVICIFIAGCGDDLEPSQRKTTEPTSIDLSEFGDEAGMKADELEHHDRFRTIENIDQIRPKFLD